MPTKKPINNLSIFPLNEIPTGPITFKGTVDVPEMSTQTKEQVLRIETARKTAETIRKAKKAEFKNDVIEMTRGWRLKPIEKS